MTCPTCSRPDMADLTDLFRDRLIPRWVDHCPRCGTLVVREPQHQPRVIVPTLTEAAKGLLREIYAEKKS